ncbi:MAG: transposase [Gammaproteobacteria bacterium]
MTSGGNARQVIFKGDAHRVAFLMILEAVVVRFNWFCHACCLMGNHYHLLIETPDANLSNGMREFNGRYTQAFNHRHRRVGHLFQGRFKAILVERDAYLLELCRYVVLNPVRAKRVRSPAQYTWSSYRATAGQRNASRFLTTDWILSQFGTRRPEAVKRYQSFVRQGVGEPSPWMQLKGQVLLGSDGFVCSLARHLKGAKEIKEIPWRQRLVNRPSLTTPLRGAGAKPCSMRNRSIRKAYLEYGYTLTEIGKHLGLHYSTISKVVNAK